MAQETLAKRSRPPIGASECPTHAQSALSREDALHGWVGPWPALSSGDQDWDTWRVGYGSGPNLEDLSRKGLTREWGA